MISLTSLPREVFYLPCDRNSGRGLVLRADDPDNKEVVLFISELNQQDVGIAVARQIDTAVVTDRMGLASLAHAILEIAVGTYPPDEGEDDVLPGLNGDGP